jgi:hypothetical protein
MLGLGCMDRLAQIVAEKMPKALELGMVSGDGRYAILCCKESSGLRRVRRYETVLDRDRAFARWEQPNATCPTAERCSGDHLKVELD